MSRENESRQRIFDYGKEVLRVEAEAIDLLLESLSSSFIDAVELISTHESNSHLIVIGMGKAGLIGRKISATFASTGTPSFFLHPAEAIHGDLGRITKYDVVLILSNSGETAEVLQILPYLKRIASPIICITGNANSTLTKHSDIVIPIGKFEEAGPHGLAPTTSTTVMLALGDALAMCTMRERRFSQEDFAFYHPGGDLGRSLMLVSEVMRSGDAHCVVNENISTCDVLKRISSTRGRPGAASIVDTNGILAGIFTDGDLRRCLEKNSEFLSKPVSEVMGKNPKTITENKLAQEALRILSEYKIDQVIVVDSSLHPVGIVDIQDLVQLKFLSTNI